MHIKGLRKKLDMMHIILKSNNAAHFPSCQQLKEEKSNTDFIMFHEVIIDIKKEFQGRFKDFDSLKPKIALFNKPVGTEVSEDPCNLILENL